MPGLVVLKQALKSSLTSYLFEIGGSCNPIDFCHTIFHVPIAMLSTMYRTSQLNINTKSLASFQKLLDNKSSLRKKFPP